VTPSWKGWTQLGPGHTSVCKHGAILDTHLGRNLIRRRHFYRASCEKLKNRYIGAAKKGVFYFPCVPLCHNLVICMGVDLTGVERVERDVKMSLAAFLASSSSVSFWVGLVKDANFLALRKFQVNAYCCPLADQKRFHFRFIVEVRDLHISW